MRLSVFVAVLCLSAAVFAQSTREVLVLTTVTEVTRSSGLSSWELANYGPYNIWCAFSSAATVVNKSKRIKPNGTWRGTMPSSVRIFCRAETASQVTGAATVLSEASAK